MQEPLNEVIASVVADALHIPHVEYRLDQNRGRPFSVCGNILGDSQELVTAHHVMRIWKRRNDHSLHRHYSECCYRLGVDTIRHLDMMLVLDYIIGNTDRHTNNFGLIRDADTLEWVGPAPVFDSGTSLGCDLRTEEIIGRAGIQSKPFRDRHADQIRLVSSFDWVDLEVLDAALPELGGIMDSYEGLIDAVRRDALLGFIMSRMDDIRLFCR